MGISDGQGRGRLSRRAVMLIGLGVIVGGGALGYELVQDGSLPGKYTLARLDGACGTGPPRPHVALPIRRETSFHSAYRGRAVTMVTLIPAHVPAGRGSVTRGLGVVIGLHGDGASASDLARQLSPAMTAAQITGFAAVTVDGGDTYWHLRANGDDPLGMIIHEVLPRLAAAGLATERIGICGESMGGYGALLLGEQLASTGGRPRPAAVAPVSPAIFASFGDAIAANRRSSTARRTSRGTTWSRMRPRCERSRAGLAAAMTTRSSRKRPGFGAGWPPSPAIGHPAGSWPAAMTTRSGAGICRRR